MNAARAAILALLMCWVYPALADVAVPPLVGRVVDQTATLSDGDIDALQQTIRAFEASKGSQMAVLMVPTTQPETIEQYSIRVAEAWKIGRKKYDDGVLLVVAKNDRKLRIEVGYGLEGALTDVTSKRIMDEIITPAFRRGDFAGGISLGVKTMMGIIEGEHLPPPPPPPTPPQQYNSNWLMNHIDPGFLFFGIIVLAGGLRALLGRLIGAIGTGGVVGLLAWLIVGSLGPALLAAVVVFFIALIVDLSSGGGRSSGGWSGSSSSSGSSWSSGSSSSSSDSGGGGGSFGGGGASGSW